MKNFRLILATAIFLVMSFAAIAQQANTLYYMDRVFPSQTVNVSEIPSNKIQVGGLLIPLFGQLPPPIYFNYGNSSFNYNHIVHFGKGEMKDSLVLDLPLLMKKVHKNTAIRSEFKIDLFNFSYRNKNNATITVNLSERVMFGTTLPRSLFDFAINGNRQYMVEGKSHDLSKLSFSASAFHELGVGYACQLGEKFSIGARMKLLFGIADISTKVTNLELTTDPENYFITALADFQIRKSSNFFEYGEDGLEVDFSGDAIKGDFLALGNLGVGLDLGLTYNVTDNISVSFSATDIGFINWLQNSQRASAKGEYTFEGVKLGFKKNDEGKLSFGLDTAMYSNIVDTIVEIFDMEIKDKSYMTWLPSNIYIGATYKLNDKIGFGLLYRGEVYHKTYIQALTVSANSNINHWLSLHGSWSIINNTALNIGAGISARLGFVTWYLVSDDIIGMIFPQKAKTLNIRMGCNLTFGHEKKSLKSATRL